MGHATVLKGQREVWPIYGSSRMLAPRPGLTSGLTSGQWLSTTDIPWIRAVCEDPEAPVGCCPSLLLRLPVELQGPHQGGLLL